ncbi:MAG TPA: DNA polymerase domain-containing protein, partial [Cellvibrionaceae bacterium]
WQQTLGEQLNITSALEIQFETHYLRFLMPTLRGSELGTKKRYAGVVENKGRRELVFKGLENVRTDWTRLAKDFQLTLYSKIFAGESYQPFVRETVHKLLAGKSDAQLIYRKRLRRKLNEYQKNIPPHVQAARKQSVHQGTLMRRGDWIDYVITTQGAEPAQYRQSPLDYQHYIDRQLMPVADAILHFVNDSFTAITDRQLGLF